MPSNKPQINISKYTQPLSAQQTTDLTRLAGLNFDSFNESDVREEFLVPLIRLLGYERNSDYSVLREQSYKLNPLFLTVGSQRIKLDYQFNVYKAGFWLLEAKGARCSDPSKPPAITEDMIGQAHFYAHHRELDCPLFGVSNGWWTNLYDRDSENPTEPIFSAFHTDLPSRFPDLYSLIGASQVTFWVKRRLLARIEQVVGADVDLARVEQFIQATQMAARRAYPKVLENFRSNAKVRQEIQSNEFRDFLEISRPFEVLDTLLMWPMNHGSLSVASDILSRKVAAHTGSNQFLFFHKLMVRETRPVTIDYYINALHLLGALCCKEELEKVDMRGSGIAETSITSLYSEFASLLLFHFKTRPDLEVLWATEGLYKRMAKRMLLSNRTARKEIAAGVELERYFQPEEQIAWLGPNPARSLMQVVESITLAELGQFFARHSGKKRSQEFDVQSAVDEFQLKRIPFEKMEDATDAAFQELTKGLGDEWSELTWSHNLNRTWDRLGHAVCEIVLSYRSLLSHLPEECRARLIELARMGNPYARDCAKELGIEVPADYSDAHARLRALFILDPKRQMFP